MKTSTAPRSSTKIVATDGRHKATAPATALVPASLKLARILVPIDFSEHSRRALSYALALAEQFSSELTLVHIMEPIVYPTDWVYPLASGDLSKEKKFLTARLAGLIGYHDVQAQSLVRQGRAWREIIDLARTNKADLIVIATHGHTGVKHAMLGSVAEKVVRHAPCPVLTVRADEHDFVPG